MHEPSCAGIWRITKISMFQLSSLVVVRYSVSRTASDRLIEDGHESPFQDGE